MTGTGTKTPIETIEPHLEPEYVGAFRVPIRETCGGVNGEYVEDITFCENPATHTVVMRKPDGDLVEIPMCDGCGEPEDVGQVVE